jgi:hypothetical protein
VTKLYFSTSESAWAKSFPANFARLFPAVEAGQLKRDGFRGRMGETFSGTHGAYGNSIVFALGSAAAAKRVQPGQLHNPFVGLKGIGLKYFTVTRIPNASGFTVHVPVSGAHWSSGVVFVEGSCVLTILDSRSRVNDRAATIALAIQVHKRTDHLRGACS